MKRYWKMFRSLALTDALWVILIAFVFFMATGIALIMYWPMIEQPIKEVLKVLVSPVGFLWYHFVTIFNMSQYHMTAVLTPRQELTLVVLYLLFFSRRERQ